jgi:hypothetical protein
MKELERVKKNTEKMREFFMPPLSVLINKKASNKLISNKLI